jgi:AcrR family transcriptional regulator
MSDDSLTPSAGRGGRREQVLESQRARVLEAMVEVVSERGLRGASAAQVARRAGVSRAVLTEQFGSVDGCFLSQLDWLLNRATELVAEAFERESSWDDGVLAGFEAMLAFFDSEHVCARVCLLESVAVPSSELQSRAQALGRLGMLVDGAGRKQLSLERQPPALMSEATVALVLGILRRRLLSGEVPPFVGLLGQLSEAVVAPYLGPAAAAQAASRGHDRAQALLKERSARLARADVEVPSMLRHASAHRMRECVRYLAENPGTSNKAVAAGIGISHPGQISVLLARLHDSGLLVKECGGAGRPNAWRLSPYGAEVARAL